MSQLDERLNKTFPDNIYYDIVVSNFQSSLVDPNPFYFNDTRTTPFIQKPEDYLLSILRFTIDTGTIPIFIPSIQPNSVDENLTIYSLSMSWTDVNSGITYQAQEYIEWQPQDLSAEVPPPPSQTTNGLQINDRGYYNCYSYQWLCYLVYVASQAVTAQMEILTNGLPNQPDFTYAPVFNWDSTNQRCVMSANVDTYDLNDAFYPVGFSPVSIYMNNPLYALFSSFPARYLGYGQPFGSDYRILVINVGGTNIQTLIPPQPAVPGNVSYEAINVYQESSTTASISPILGIVFTTNTLPILANQISTPLVYNNNQILDYAGNNSATANIVTDLVSDSGTYSPNLVYTPSAEFRRITMFGNSPLVNLDLNIFYKLRNGSLQPFRLQSGGSVTMKILFEKK